jgi:hypothetical protein
VAIRKRGSGEPHRGQLWLLKNLALAFFASSSAACRRLQAIGPSKIVSTAKKIPKIMLSVMVWIGHPINHPSRKLAITCAHPYHFFRFTPKPIPNEQMISNRGKRKGKTLGIFIFSKDLNWCQHDYILV